MLLDGLLDTAGAGHFVTTRRGGLSPPPFDTLNLSRAVGDSPSAVEANWDRVLAAIGARPDMVAVPNQCHGTSVLTIEHADEARARPADGLVTMADGLVLAVLVADCAPVLAVDANHRVVGVAHAGWRGTIAGITPALIRAMTEAGAAARNIHLAVGPCIGFADYEVGEEVAGAVRSAFAEADWPALLRPSVRAAQERPRPVAATSGPEQGRWLFDLGGANVRQALECGLVMQNVSVSGRSTRSEMDVFFSHRGSGGRTGRFAAGVWLRNPTQTTRPARSRSDR